VSYGAEDELWLQRPSLRRSSLSGAQNRDVALLGMPCAVAAPDAYERRRPLPGKDAGSYWRSVIFREHIMVGPTTINAYFTNAEQGSLGDSLRR
jgi:hypothetical protein